MNSLLIYFSGSIPSGAEGRQAAWLPFPPLQRVQGGWGVQTGLGDTALDRANPGSQVNQTPFCPAITPPIY